MLVPARHCQPVCRCQTLTVGSGRQLISAVWPVALAGGSKHEARVKEARESSIDSRASTRFASACAASTSIDNEKRF